MARYRQFTKRQLSQRFLVQKVPIVDKKKQMHVYEMSPTQLPHKFSYIVVILIHNHFDSPNRFESKVFISYFNYNYHKPVVSASSKYKSIIHNNRYN
jgi:hypothetical protein